MLAVKNFFPLINTSPIPFLILHADAPDYTIADANDVFLKLIDATREQIIGRKFFDAFPENPDDAGHKRRKVVQTSLEYAHRLKKNHKISLLRYDIPVGESGAFEIKFWNCDTYPLLDEEGEVAFIVKNPVDISRLIISDNTNHFFDDAAFQGKNFDNTLFHDLPEAACTLDLNGNFLSANQALADLAGCTVDALLQLSFISFIPPENLHLASERFQRSANGEKQHFESSIITAKGTRMDVEATYLPIRVNDKVIAVYLIAKDITQMKESAEHLKVQHAQLEAANEKIGNILETITDAFFAINKNWVVTYWNKEAARMLGVPREVVIQRNIWQVFDRHVHVKSYQEYLKAMTENVSVTFQDYYPQKDTWFEVSAFPSEDGLSIFFRDITERKRSEEAVNAAMLKYYNLFNSSPIPKWVYDAETLRFLDVNEAAIQHYGYSREEFLNISLKDIIYDADHSVLDEIMQSASTREIIKQDAIRHTQKSGEVIFVNTQRNPITFDNKDAWLLMVIDVTEKLKTERALKESEQRFKSLIQNSSDLIAIVDENEVYKYISPSAKRILGVGADKLIGKSIGDFVCEEDRKIVRKQSVEIKRVKQVRIPPFRIRTADNKIKWLETVLTDLTDDPAVLGIVVNSRDVTQRILDEKQLKDHIERFNIVLKATSDIIWDWNMLTNRVIRNKGLKSVLRQNELPVLTEWWDSHLHPDDRERVMKNIENSIRQKKSRVQDQYRLIDAKGGWRTIFDRGFIIYNEKGEAIRAIGAMQDITQRENSLQAIKEQNAKLLEIAWMQAHTVRAPLSRIMSLINLINDVGTDEITRNECLQYVDESVKELDDVITQIIRKAENVYEGYQ